MEKNFGLSGLVYDYYETRIRFGYYRYGDELPPIPRICATFHLGRTTVRNALAHLEEEGYIKTEERRPAQVIYQASPEKLYRNAAEFYLPREEGIREFDQAGQLLLIPFWEEGLRRLESGEWEEMEKNLDKDLPGKIPLSVEMYIIALSTLKNRLILNLYWECISYIRFPYVASKKERHISREEFRENLSQDITTFLNREFDSFYQQVEKDLFDFIKEAPAVCRIEEDGQIPFRWNIYRQRPQLKYSVASLLIREILEGKYPAGSYLPSLPQMVERYGISETTVRRTLSLLENLGVTCSYQGKGTKVCMGQKKIQYWEPEIQEGMRLYRESLQLLAVTIRGISNFTLGAVSKEKRAELMEKLCSIRKNGHSSYCFEVFLKFIHRECPLAMVRECYGKLLELMAWGYPFVLSRTAAEPLDAVYAETVERMENFLREDNLPAFSSEWKKLLEREELFYSRKNNSQEAAEE